MSWHGGLREEIEEMFANLLVPSLAAGFHRHRHLSLVRLTTHEQPTAEQRAAKRRALEKNRRKYKTTKQREYDRAKKEAA